MTGFPATTFWFCLPPVPGSSRRPRMRDSSCVFFGHGRWRRSLRRGRGGASSSALAGAIMAAGSGHSDAPCSHLRNGEGGTGEVSRANLVTSQLRTPEPGGAECPTRGHTAVESWGRVRLELFSPARWPPPWGPEGGGEMPAVQMLLCVWQRKTAPSHPPGGGEATFLLGSARWILTEKELMLRWAREVPGWGAWGGSGGEASYSGFRLRL